MAEEEVEEDEKMWGKGKGSCSEMVWTEEKQEPTDSILFWTGFFRWLACTVAANSAENGKRNITHGN